MGRFIPSRVSANFFYCDWTRRYPTVPPPMTIRSSALNTFFPRSPPREASGNAIFQTSELGHFGCIASRTLSFSLARNASAGNLEFGAKKEKYFQAGGVSPFAITTQVLNSPAWTIDVLQKRQENSLQLVRCPNLFTLKEVFALH